VVYIILKIIKSLSTPTISKTLDDQTNYLFIKQTKTISIPLININNYYKPLIHIKHTIRSALYVDIHLEIDSEGRLRTKPYDKADYFNLPIMNLPLYITTFQHYLHMGYIPFSCYNITELVVPMIISLKEGTSSIQRHVKSKIRVSFFSLP
jgi:hypothetical protein